jgi:hypothetical protein
MGAAVGLSSMKSLSLVFITINSQLPAGLRFSNVSGTVSWQNNNRETKERKGRTKEGRSLLAGTTREAALRG